MDAFNLNIDEYKDSELEELMRLSIPYTNNDVTKAKEVLLRQLITNADLSAEKKREITFFVDSIASRIANIAPKRYKLAHRPHQKPHQKPHDEGTWAEKKVPIAQYGSNIIIKNPNEIVGKHAKITEGRLSMSGQVPPGYINPINVRTTSRAINIDSRFRPNYYKTLSTQFSMHLPEIEKRVVKMTVGALEIPLTYHAISENLGNNKCLIIDNCSNLFPDPSGWLVKLPDGNYGTNELKGAPGSAPSIDMDIDIAMNNAIATADAGTLNINTGDFTPTVVGAKLDPAQDVCYRWDRISGRSVFACPENASCSSGGGGAGAADWVERSVGSPDPAKRRWKGIASDSTGDKLIACEQGSLGTVTDLCSNSLYVSGDSGVTWTNVWNPQTTSPGASPPPYDSSMNWTSVCSDSTGDNLGAISYDGSGAFSADGGSSWTLFNATVGAPVYILPDTSYNTIVSSKIPDAAIKYACSLNGPIKKSDDSGATWTMCPGVTAEYPVLDSCSNITQEWFTTVYSGSSSSYIRAKGIGWVGDHLIVGIHALNGAMTGAVNNSVEANFGTVASGCDVGFMSKTDVLTGIDVNDSIWTTKWPATLFPAVEGGNTSQGLVSTRALVVDTSEKVYVAGFVGNCGGQDGGYIRDPTTQTDGSNNNFWKDGRQSNGPIAGTGPNAPLGVGLSNAFVSKYDADGTRIWSRGIQTTSNVICASLTTDSNNNVIAPGHTKGLLAKNGVGTDLGGSGWLSGGATYGGLGAGSMVNITSTELPAGVNGYQGENGFVVKFDEDGVPLYYTMIWSDGSGGTGGTGLVLPTSDNGTQLNAVTTDSNNDVYIGGKTKAALYGDPSSNPFPVFTQATPFIKKLSDTLTFALDSAGNSWDRYIIPATFTLSNNGSATNSVVTDSLDNIYAVGLIKEAVTNKESAFLAKYSNSGVPDTTFAVIGGGGSSNDLDGVKIYQNTLDAAKSLNFQSCYIDNNDRLFVVGTYGGSGASGMEWDISSGDTSFPGTTDVSNGSIGTTPAFGDNDIVLYVFNTTTALVEDSHLLKITNDNDGAQGYYSITGDTSNNIYICGGADATTGVQTPYTWKAKYSGTSSSSGVGAAWTNMCCDVSGLAFAACNETHIYTSDDSGNTLTQREAGLWKAITCDDSFNNLAAVDGSGATPGNIYLSNNSATTWSQLSTGVGFPPVNQNWSAITMNGDGSVIAATIGGDETVPSSTGTIWISTNGGGAWAEQTPPPSTMPGTQNWQAITSNADGSKLAAVVGDGSQESPGSIVGNVWTLAAGGGGGGGGGSCECMDFTVRFTIDKTGNLDMNDSIQFKLGWPLGFRGGEYMTSGAAVSEGICFISGPRYGFLAINDYQKNQGKSYILAFANSSLDENIMVRLNLAAVQDKVGVYKSANDPGLTTQMNRSRDYFGPVDIQKLTVTLYDEYGRVMDINNMDWSFTLTLERLYD